MSRTRLIKPALFENEILGQLPGDTVLCFAGLWCLADREGRLEDRPMRIKAKLFPYREVNVDASLQQLADGGFITRYQIGGESFIQIINFLKHQHPHRAEQSSVIPAYGSTDQGQTKDSSCRALTLNLIPSPDTLTLNPSSPPGDSVDGDASDMMDSSRQEEAALPLPDALNTLEFRKSWDEWLAYRQSIKKPLKAMSQEKQLAALATMGVTAAIESINASIVNGWTGLFPSRPAGHGSPKAPLRESEYANF